MPGHCSDKEKRQAHHIEESEEKEGKSKKEAERIAYATVNKGKSMENPEGPIQTQMHPHRQTCSQISEVFHMLANEKAFGDLWRSKCAECAKSLGGILSEYQKKYHVESANVTAPTEHPEPEGSSHKTGEIGEKALIEQQRKQAEQISYLNKAIENLVSRL